MNSPRAHTPGRSGRLRRLGISLVALGFDPRALWRSLRFLPGYLSDALRWRRLARAQAQAGEAFDWRWLPTLSDKHAAGGVAKGHYFHQDLWVARQVHAAAPRRHLDVGSRIDGFVAHLLCFRDVEVVDIRPLNSQVPGLSFLQADIMSSAPTGLAPADSVSCLHALEHFGLGRYGDPLSPEGWRQGLRQLASLVAPGGRLYLGVPIGRPAVEFNAQRIFHPLQMVEAATELGLVWTDFAHVDDDGALHVAAQPSRQDLQALGALDYGCGIYVFERPQR